jgi:hypothetical protein
MASVTRSAREHEALLCAALDSAATSLEIAKEKCGELRHTWPHDGSLVQETRSSIRHAREALDALDALPWPNGESDRENAAG